MKYIARITETDEIYEHSNLKVLYNNVLYRVRQDNHDLTVQFYKENNIGATSYIATMCKFFYDESIPFIKTHIELITRNSNRTTIYKKGGEI